MKLFFRCLCVAVAGITVITFGAEKQIQLQENCKSQGDGSQSRSNCSTELPKSSRLKQEKASSNEQEEKSKQLKRLLLSQRISSVSSVDLPDDI